MNASLKIEALRVAGHSGTPMASVSLPDLVAYVISIAMVIFLWLQ